MTRNDLGFTLIELMIVVMVILLLSGISVSAYFEFNKTQTVNNDGRQLVSELLRARSLATNLYYPSGCSSLKGVQLESVLINGVLSGTRTTIDCLPDDIVESVKPTLNSSRFLGDLDLYFLPSSGYSSSGTTVEVTIVDTKDANVTKTIDVDQFGQVN